MLYPDKPRLEALPERGLFPTESLVSDREIAVAASGEMTVRETLRVSGYFAMGWRSWAIGIQPSERLAALQNVPRDSRWHVEKFTAEGLDDNFAELVLTFHYTMPATSAALVSPAIWERDYLEVPFLKERRFPMELLHPMRIESHVKLQLPRAADAQALKALAKSGESEFGKWKLDAKGEPGNAKAVTISFDYQAPTSNLPAARYGEWQNFRSKAVEAWQQPLKLE